MEKLPLTIVPSSTVKLPVNGKEYRVRAMNIREEKNLLTAKDAANTDDILFCINELVKECTYGKLDFNNLCVPDVIALFLKIIELSKGPTCVHTYICHNEVNGEDCLGKIEVEVDLRTVKFNGGKRDKLITLPGGIILEMQYPTAEIYNSAMRDAHEHPLETQLRAYAYCIKSVIQGETVYNEFTRDEIYEWVLNMDESILNEFKKFFDDIPSASLTYDIVCPKCGHKETVTLTNVEDFFTQDIPGIL